MEKKIRFIVNADVAPVGNETVNRPLPTRALNQVGPFILLDHFGPKDFAVGKKMDVPPHPHAGIETVTYFLKGEGYHKDSLGSAQVIRPLELNWMTTGKGIVHLERMNPPEGESGKLEGFQIWVNLPQAQKWISPSFKHFSRTQLPEIELADEQVWLKILAGEVNGEKSAATFHSPLFLYHLKMRAGASFLLSVPQEQEAGIYGITGSAQADGLTFGAKQLALFEELGTEINITAKDDFEAIVLGGKPLNEPISSYGPFVMNNLKEVQKVIQDYEMGKMGSLEAL